MTNTLQQNNMEIVSVDKEPEPKRVEVAINNCGLAPADFDGMYRIAMISHASGLHKSFDTPQACFIAMATGAELGFSPMKSLQSFAVINGKATLYGDAMIGLVMASGQLEDMDEYFEDAKGNRVNDREFPKKLEQWDDGVTAVCEVVRKGMKESVSRFSVGDAKQAGLWMKTGRNGQSTPWITHPKRMLKYKARAFGLRDRFADYLGGLHMYEEMQGEQGFDPSRMAVAHGNEPEKGSIADRIRSIPNEAKDESDDHIVTEDNEILKNFIAEQKQKKKAMQNTHKQEANGVER